MPKIKTVIETYDSCVAEGYYKITEEVNIELIKSLLDDGKTNIECAQIIIKSISKNAKQWKNVFKNYYDALHSYAEGLLYFHSIKSANHQCLFASLCIKYPSLELDWEFLEQIRVKRNSISYYGESITYGDWKKIEFQLTLYCSSLNKEIEKRLI